MTLSFHELPPPVIFTPNETLHSIALPPLAEFLTGIDTTDRILKLHDILQRFRTPKSYHRVDVRFVESSELPPKSPVAERNLTLHDVEAEHRTQANGTAGEKEANGFGDSSIANGTPEPVQNGPIELSEEEKRERGWPITLPEGMTKADYLLGPEPPSAVDVTDNQEEAQAPPDGEATNGVHPQVNGQKPLLNGDGPQANDYTAPNGHLPHSPAASPQAGPPPQGEVNKDRASPSPIPAHLLPPTNPSRRIRELRLDLRTLDAAALFALETWRRELLGLEKLQLEHPDSVWYEDQPEAESSTAPAKIGRGRPKKNRTADNGTTASATVEDANGIIEGEDGKPEAGVEMAREESEESHESDNESPVPIKDDLESEYEDDRPARPPRLAPVEVNGDVPKKKRGRPRKIRPEEVVEQQEPDAVSEDPDGAGASHGEFEPVQVDGEGTVSRSVEVDELHPVEIHEKGSADIPKSPLAALDSLDNLPQPDTSIVSDTEVVLDESVEAPAGMVDLYSASPRQTTSPVSAEPEDTLDDPPADGSPLLQSPVDESVEAPARMVDLYSASPRQTTSPVSAEPEDTLDDPPADGSPLLQSPVPSEGEPELDSMTSDAGMEEDERDSNSSPGFLLDSLDEQPDDMDSSAHCPPTTSVSQKRKGKARAISPKRDSSNFNFPSASFDDISFASGTHISRTLDFDMDTDHARGSGSRSSGSRSISPLRRIRLSTDQSIFIFGSRRRTMDAVVIPARTKRNRVALRAQEVERAVRFASPSPAPSAESAPSGLLIIALSPETEDEVEVIEPVEWRPRQPEVTLDEPINEDEVAVLDRMDDFIRDELVGADPDDDLDDGGIHIDSIDGIVTLDGQDEWSTWDDRVVEPTLEEQPMEELEESPEAVKMEPHFAPAIEVGPTLALAQEEEEESAGDDGWSFLR